MESNEIFKIFSKARNNFTPHPLSGEELKKFYVDSFNASVTDEISITIRTTESYQKILIIGHRGCGKSTILNKIVGDLDKEYFILSFSVADVLNLMDVETVDLLLATYMQLLESINTRNIPHSLDSFEEMMGFAKKKFKLKEVGVSLLKILSFKIQVENESRKAIRDELRTRIEALQKTLIDLG